MVAVSTASVVTVLACAVALGFASPAVAGTTVVNEAGRLAFVGDDGPNEVSIDLSADSTAYVVTIGGGIDGSTGCVPVSPGRLSCPRNAGSGRLLIDAGREQCLGSNDGLFGGNDSFKAGYGSDNVHPSDQVLVELGPGDDFFGGSEGRDVVSGGGGDDVLDGAEGNDELDGAGSCDGALPGFDQVFGGPGSDSLYGTDSAPVGPDVLDGGGCSAAVHPACPAGPPAEAAGDYDTVSYRSRTADLTLNLADGAASQGERGEGDIVRNVEHADTGEGNDTVTGNAAANIINTNGGDDTVDVSGDIYPAFADVVGCGAGNDTATGDAHDIFKHEFGLGSAGICETLNLIETRVVDPGGARPGGGPTPPVGGGSPTVDRTPAAVARELTEAGRALERCGTTALLSKRGCRDAFTALGPGTVVYRVTAPARGGRAVAVLASGRRAIPAAGTYAVKVNATRKARKRLRRARKLRATLTVSFTGPRGTAVARSTPVVLKRKRR